MAPVALVVVSHSGALATGVRELVVQMAPDVTVTTAGGSSDGSLGTDLERVQAAIAAALEAGEHAVVLCDLGSAVMTAEMAVELLDDPDRAVLGHGPLVEGALAAAVAAQGGAGIDAVLAAVRDSGRSEEPAPEAGGGMRGSVAADVAARERTVTLRNPLGLHARPAAQVAALAGAAAGRGTLLQVGREGDPLTDAAALLRVVALGLRGGDRVRVVASGTQAEQALDQLADLLLSGFGESERDPAPTGSSPSPTPVPPPAGGLLQGIAASPGTAVAPVLVLGEPAPDLGDEVAADPEEERRKADAARDEVALRLGAMPPEHPGADVLAMHAALLADPDLDAAVAAQLRAGRPAASAWWSGALEVADGLAGSGDAFLAERSADVRDVALQVLEVLGSGAAPPPRAEVAGRVVVADSLPPSWVPVLAERGTVGLALAGAGPTAHAVVLARGLGLPCVVSLGPSLLDLAGALAPDREVVLDGSAGTVALSPPDERVATARARARAESASAEARRAGAQAAVTVQGRVVPVLANVASVTESARARQEGADGIGLVRTELMLADRTSLPTEDEQVEALTAIAREQGARRVVVRTFDVGGDKPVAALDLDPVRHGFLGERGLRLSLARRDLLRVQLRAVLRAAAEVAGDGTQLALMAPMVTVSEEVVTLQEELTAARSALQAEGREVGELAGVGVMVEVPAAALAVEELAALVDFVSVGTNDLVQYVMAAERTNTAVAHLYRPDHPAVWRTLQILVDGAHAGGCEVGVCGQMAAEPELARRLVALGVDDLSVPPSDVGRVKDALRG